MKVKSFILLLPIVASLPVGTSFKPLTPKTPSMPAAVEKHVIAPLDKAWSAVIRNAKAAKYVLKAEVKEQLVEKPVDEWHALWEDRKDTLETEFRDPVEFQSYISDTDADTDSDSDDERPLGAQVVVSKKTSPAYLKANMRDLSYQPYVRTPRPAPKSIYDKRSEEWQNTYQSWTF